MKHFDAIIIGSGQGGTPLSKKLAKNGWNTALIEMQQVGGACINTGCTPTKTMIASAKAAYDLSKVDQLGIEVGEWKVNMPAIIERKAKIVELFRNGSLKGLKETDNLTLIFGKASFAGSKTVEVKLNSGETEVVTADKIFLDTGTRPSIPPVDGLEKVGYFTSTSLMECKTIPAHLLIIGGGYIGLEFGQMYRRFGSKVTILEFSDRFLPAEDEDIAAEVLQFLSGESIEIVTSARLMKVHKKGEVITASLQVGTENKTVECTHLLVAAGRTPNTDSLNLEVAGVELNKQGYINVNEKLETTAAGIYALGDVKGGPEFTHIAYNDYIVLYNNLVKGAEEHIGGRLVPYTMFTDPQLGRIGLTEQQAREKGLDIKVATLPMAHVARAIETGDERGIMKAIVDAGNGKLLGAAIIGTEGGEIMSVLEMAMVGNITWQQIRRMIFAHPLYAESLNNLFMKLEETA